MHIHGTKIKQFIIITMLGLLNHFNISATVLPIPQKYMEEGKKNWSWAAASQAVLEYFEVYVSQTEIANYGTGGLDVSNVLHSSVKQIDSLDENKEFEPLYVSNFMHNPYRQRPVDQILLKFGNIKSWGYDLPAKPEKVFEAISDFRVPVLIRWNIIPTNELDLNPRRITRVVVIKGAEYINGILYLTLMDPVDGTYRMDYKSVVRNDKHIWVETLEIITRPPIENESFDQKVIPGNLIQNISNIDLPENPDWDGVSLHKP